MKYIKAIAFMMLAVLAADLLYLCHIGVWYDPSVVIETIEMTLLGSFVGTGLALAIKELI